MSRIRFAPAALAATIALGALAAPADALTAYDARTLGMGGNSVGFATNGSLAYWNPAAVANGTKFGLFLPSVGVSFSNNLIGTGDVANFATTLQNLTAGKGGTSTVWTQLGAAEGLNLQAEVVSDLLGFNFGRVGPGGLQVRLYAHSLSSVRMGLSPALAGDINNLFSPETGIAAMAATVGQISAKSGNANANTPAEIKADVQKLKGLITGSMSSLLKGKQSISADINVGANGVAAATYAMPIPLKIAIYPEAQLSLGTTAKFFGAINGLVPPMQLQGAPGGKTTSINTLGMGAAINLDVDTELTNLLSAIDSFEKETSLASTVDVIDKSTKLLETGLGKNSSLAFSSLAPTSAGFGMDLGAHFRFDKWWAVGATLVNPIMLWPATKSYYKYTFTSSGIQLLPDTTKGTAGVENTNNWAAEPMMIRLGAAWTPQLQGRGAPILVNDILVTGGLESAIITGTNLPPRPAISLGVEKLFGPLALRLGTQQLGFSPFYTGGLGIQTSIFQLNLGGGVDNPSNIKGAAVSLNMGFGF